MHNAGLCVDTNHVFKYCMCARCKQFHGIQQWGLAATQPGNSRHVPSRLSILIVIAMTFSLEVCGRYDL